MKAPERLSLSTLVISILLVSRISAAPAQSVESEARAILEATGVKGGLVVHVGCGAGALTAALGADKAYLVHGLDADAAHVRAARERIASLGLYGRVSADRLEGKRLPYIDNLVNLVVSEDLGAIPQSEVLRVLCPNGVAYLKQGGAWVKRVKPRPEQLDEWTHYLHDASNNAVSHDTVVGPPRRLQWLGSPRWARHHDRMSSVSGAVSAGGRVFYIFDEASRASVLVPPQWTLIARDAYNGTVLWKRPLGKWHTHLWPLKSGPANLPRRLVAAGDRVYVTVSLDAPLTALDAATGEVVRTYEGTSATEEVIHRDGLLFLLVDKDAEPPEFANLNAIKHAYGGAFWSETPRRTITAIRAGSGEVLWTSERTVLPVTLAADGRCVYFHDGSRIVSLDRLTGDEVWRSEPIACTDVLRSFYAPTLLVYDGVVLFSGGETAGQQTGSWYMSGKDTMTALSAETGQVLWSAYHPPSGYRSAEDLLVADGLVWTGETTSGRAVGVFSARDPYTGEVKCEFPPGVDTYWFHHRCYRGKATDKYLLMSRTGTEFIDVRDHTWSLHHWVRGACLYGLMPANGLLYAPQHPCACYLETKLFGFNALAPASEGPRVPARIDDTARLEKGPAYGAAGTGSARDGDWPTYRGNARRSGATSASVPYRLKRTWQARVGGRLTSPVVAGGKLFVASIDAHRVYALDAATGEAVWSFAAGGRVDSPPTFHNGRVLFGSADGWVYSLRASDGVLAWRFRAAPMDQRTVAFEQLESVWPVHGSVLIRDGVLYCVAGRSMFLDGGLRLLRLDPKTGRKLSETVMTDVDPQTGQDIHTYVSWLNMPVALPDILSSEGDLVYMRSQPFRLDGTRLPLKAFPKGTDADRGAPAPIQDPDHAHLFSPTGFLDDSYWHRTYWMYGSRFVSGWCGYYLAGKAAPAGRILVFDDENVYGFGRKPRYYRWTTPIEHHLFAASKASLLTEQPADDAKGSCVRIAKSASLNPAGKALTVEAWIKAEKPGGVVVSRGGSVQGYTLYLKNGRPHFAVRTNEKLASVGAAKRAVGRWVHLAGVLTAEKKLRLYVDGRLAGSASAPALIGAAPSQPMEIAADEGGGAVGDYAAPFPFKGLIDEVRIYHHALSDAEIRKHASSVSPEGFETTDLVLWYSFDAGDARDASGRKNKGTVVGAAAAAGRIGRALQFTGKAGSGADFFVTHAWTAELPLLARAMVLADETLFVAGVPDVIDEEQTFKRIDDPAVQPDLAAQAEALAGHKGALLMAVSRQQGKELARYKLDSPPVFDGMAAAGGCIYMTTVDGRVCCLGRRGQDVKGFATMNP